MNDYKQQRFDEGMLKITGAIFLVLGVAGVLTFPFGLLGDGDVLLSLAVSFVLACIGVLMMTQKGEDGKGQ